jgi:superfamily I DNA/RNA helicase
VLDRLVNQESLEPSQIVVLTLNGHQRSRLKEGDAAGTFTLGWGSPAAPGRIRVSTPHAFKGLESPVVILAEPEGFRRQRQPDELMYVALSRAKHHLIVLGDLPAPRNPAGTIVPAPGAGAPAPRTAH